ncbi:hypothetical protein L5515_013929 [Caenorhabditis briggsae]|uniref:Uncharacterized protein n=1 Tax=Caenorhabditis briggsae TaxID=6238 RepID=A0AAE9E7R3_CAEBR|nr:hypothetical protein L5515_013929 [Caenorhabditis briggsae]
MMSLFCLYFNIHPISVLSFLLSAQAFVIYTFLPPDQSDVHLAVLLVVLMPIFSIKRNEDGMNGVARRKQFKLRPWQSTALPARHDHYSW